MHKLLLCWIILSISTSYTLAHAKNLEDLSLNKVKTSRGYRKFYSQASQDKFVFLMSYCLSNKQDQGYYLEIGSGDPVKINNTYFLEKNFNWRGINIDYNEGFCEKWASKRVNNLHILDATKADYQDLLQNFPKVIDYLSLDIDNFYDIVLERVLASNHVFKIITIEHDCYRYGDKFKDRERLMLKSKGYHLLCSGVSLCGGSFEDWWINPEFFGPELIQRLSLLDLDSKDHKILIETLNSTYQNSSKSY
jgi:hypothetical protein